MIVHIINAKVRSVAHQFTHRRSAVHASDATGQLPRLWHAAADQTMQQSGAASDQQRRLYGAYGRALNMLLHDAPYFTD